MTGSPLSDRLFRRFLVARCLSAMGGWMQVVAAGWLMYQLTGSAVQVGVLAAVAKGPSIVAAPLGGWLADRVDRRRLALVLTAAETVPVALLTLLALDGVLDTTQLYVLVFLSCIPNGLSAPVLFQLLPDLVPQDDRHRAIAVGAAAYNVARLAGPALGGLLVATQGPAAAFGINTLSYAAVALALLRTPAAALRLPAGRGPSTGFLAGSVHLWRPLLLRTLLLSVVAFFVLVGPLEQVMPVVAAEHGDDPRYVGLLLASLALGGVLATPVVRRLELSRWDGPEQLAGALACSGVVIVVLGFSEALVLDLVALVTVGAASQVIWVAQCTTVDRHVPVHVRGQAMGWLLMLSRTSAAVGALVLGMAFEAVGVAAALIGTGATLGASGGLLAWRSHRRPAPTD